MSTDPEELPVLLTQAQRKAIAFLLPAFTGRMKLDGKNQRTIRLTLKEMKVIRRKVAVAVRHVTDGIVRNSLLLVQDILDIVIDQFQGIGSISAPERIYQFKITLEDYRPLIWRRIQVRDGTLDKLHEHIQTAMGWTNSHLHDFEINGQKYGDPMLLDQNFDEMNYKNSTTTEINEIVPKSGRRFRFSYEYDFGDCWEHDILFEGCLRAERGKRYPVCVEGERACPPEDVGGVPGYREFLKAIADPDHEEHDSFVQWIGGRFDPEAFNPVTATREMRRGLPDWRREAWV